MTRREFGTLLGSGVLAWPLAALAQQPGRMRCIGTLLPAAEDDAQFDMFLQELGRLGWIIGQNTRIDTRWTTGNTVDIRRHAMELVALAPDVILAHGITNVAPLLQATHTVPIVFVAVSDQVGGRFDSLGAAVNATGFMADTHGVGGRKLELLRRIAPNVTRVAILRDASRGAGNSEFAGIQDVALTLGVKVDFVNVREAGEIERGVASFARAPNGGLIVTADPQAARQYDLIVALAARHKLPAVYSERFFAAGGGLVSYGPNYVDEYRRAAGYVDRILKGEMPASLPVARTKFELVVNLKTAKVLGLEVPADLFELTDEVIE